MPANLLSSPRAGNSSATMSRRLLAAVLALLALPASGLTGPCQANLVISQVYGGGGLAGAVYTHDFVELHNPGINTVSLAGYAIQYASATGSSWQVSALPNASIPPGGYFLIREASGGGIGAPLPMTEATGSIDLANAAGKVALTNSTTALSGTCPSGAAIQDFVGYGVTASCFEGAAPAPIPSSALSIKRTVDTCGDTNDNAADFAPGAPEPRNGATLPQVCECSVNETGAPSEIMYCNLQFPATIGVDSGTATPVIYAQVYQAGVTDPAGPSPGITAQIGYGAQGVDPTTQAGFTWFPASYNTQAMANDEYQASLIAPGAGAYAFTSRFTRDGVNWTHCDLDGAGSNMGVDFSAAQMGTMTVTQGPLAPQITSPNTVTFNPGINGTFTPVATGFPAPGFSLSGALPSGVTFNGMTGTLAGIPAAGTAGGYPLTFTATNGVMPDATQNFALVVANNCTLDTDGNGAVDALTDGLLMLRAMFGLTGNAVVNNAVGDQAIRSSWSAIRDYLNTNCGTSFPGP